MNSSDDELPEIPGTRYPWMTDEKKEESAAEQSTSSNKR